MPEPLLRQFSSFLLFIGGGIAVGFLFDFLRAVRSASRPRGFSSFLLDMGFWFAALAVTLPLLAVGTWGELRLFVWLAMLIGWVYYHSFLRKICQPLLRSLVKLPLTRFLLLRRLRRGPRLSGPDTRASKR